MASPQKIQVIKNNPNLSGPDKNKLTRLHCFENNGITYFAGLYNQSDKATNESFFHYRISAKKNGQDIALVDFKPIQDFLGKNHPYITFIQVFPADSDIIDEDNTYHFFGLFQQAKTTKGIINTLSGGTTEFYITEPMGFQGIQHEKARLGYQDRAAFQLMTGTGQSIQKLIQDPTHIFIPNDNIHLPNLRELRTFGH